MTGTPGRRERRWVVLAQAPDGRYVTLARAADPSEAEILGAEAALRRQGLGGWLAVMEGNPYAGPLPTLLEVRALASPAGSFADAAAACLAGIVALRNGAIQG